MTLAPPPTDLDDLLVTDDPLPADIHAGDTTSRDRPIARQIEILSGLGVFGFAAHVVELHFESIGEQEYAITEDAGTFLGYLPKVGLVNGVTETHGFLCRR